MSIFRSRYIRPLAGLALGGTVVAALACGGGEEKIVEVTRVVQQTAAPVVQTVVVEKEKIVEKEKQVQVTKVVEKQVEVTKVVQQTVTVQQTVVVVQTATATPIPVPKGVEQVSQPNPKSAAGSVVMAVSGPLNDQNGLCRAQACEGTHYQGIGETLFLRASSALNPGKKDDETIPWIATAWRLETDANAKAGLSAIISIREGIKFHNVKPSASHSGDWGTLTAQDVAFTINDANFGTPKPGVDLYKYSNDYNADATAKYTPDSIHGQAGDFDIFYEVQVIDSKTIKVPFVSFDSTWTSDYLSQSGQAVSIMSKKAHDYTDGSFKNPGDFVRTRVVETGPFKIESWTRDDKMTYVSRYAAGQELAGQKHYLPELTPKTAKITEIQAPDPTSRVALLRAGDVDIAFIQPKDAPQFTKDGKSFGIAGVGATQLGVFFSGNLWETVSAKDGSPLNPYASGGVYQADWPWIGDPRKPEDMEEARQVRLAMAEAYDREAINKALLGGLGLPVHVEYVSITHQRFQKDPSKGWKNADGTANLANLKWPYKFDPKGAQDRIKSSAVQGDYNKGAASGGPLGAKAFETSIYAGPELGGGLSLTGEVVDAVAGYWTDLGLKVFSLKFAYQTFRPSVVNRTNTIPFVTSCDKGNEANPWAFPKGLVQTSLSRGGFSCGFESPEILKFYQATAKEQDPAKAEQLVDQYIQYMYDQALQPGIVAVPNLWIFNAKKVKAWPMPQAAAHSLDAYWNLELQAGQ